MRVASLLIVMIGSRKEKTDEGGYSRELFPPHGHTTSAFPTAAVPLVIAQYTSDHFCEPRPARSRIFVRLP